MNVEQSGQVKSMRVDTGKVTGRRRLRFEKLSDILADAERLASGEVRQLGNWSLGEMCRHLAKVMNMSIDGSTFRAPLLIRLMLRPMRRTILNNTMRPGIQLPPDAAAAFGPEAASTEEGLRHLRAAIERLERDPQRSPSPYFGKLGREDWDRLHMRHAELHLSFLVPVDQNPAG